MSVTTSAAAFRARALELGLTEEHIDRLVARGFSTFGELAFSSSYTPGHASDAPFVAAVIIPVLGDAEHVKQAALRRLFYEAYSFVSAEMRSKVERTDSDAPKRLPVPERASRMRAFVARLPGVQVTGPYEPSHALVDLFTQCYEDNSLAFVPYERLTSREQEVLNLKKDPEAVTWAADAQGTVRVKRPEPSLVADTASELKMQIALHRRGVALELSNLMSFEVHRSLVDVLFQALFKEVPGGFRRVSLSQVVAADKRCWVCLAESTAGGVQVTPMGVRPLDRAMPDALLDTDFRLALTPLPAGQKADPDHAASAVKRSAPPAAKAAASAKQGQQPSKRQRTGRGSGGQVPRELAGLHRFDNRRRPICFAFNLDGCDKAKAGEVCPRGAHVCSKPGCYQPHSQRNCPGKQ